jgi:RNA polymerase sigma-70 factor (ECF subfamily)
LDEILLIQSAKEGNRTAFTQLVEKYQHMVFNTVLGIVQQTEEAEDTAQEVFIQLYQSIQTFRGDSKFSTWLYRIAVTKALEVERKKKAKKRFNQVKQLIGMQTAAETVTDFYHPGIALHQKEEAAILMKAIKQLPENQKAAFILIKTEGLSYEEVSKILNTSIKGIEALMHRAKENLRKILTIYYSKNK